MTEYHKLHARKGITSGLLLLFSAGFLIVCIKTFIYAYTTNNADGAGAVALFILASIYLVCVYTGSILKRWDLYKRTKPN